ncbi:glycan-binding surface protein [Negadavirga shengliensis]|uniref:Glycan-binding surface protein n=1 Tax=Negadavirga shengliensis TaxID=1389218 RepID=A0ABV9T6N5_9BACT
MEKTRYKYVNRLLLACAAVMMTLMFACEKEDSLPAPLITSVRNYDASPNDTLITEMVTGQWVVIHGKNLREVSQVYFGGVQASINSTFLTDANIVVQIPSIPFQSVPIEELNKITVVSAGGTYTYSIDFAIDPPAIASVSYEIPNEGDSVYIYGANFFYVEEVTFAGEPIPELRLSADGTSLGFIAPALSQSGPVKVKTGSGTATTGYNVNDVATGLIANFEWGDYFGYEWWGGAELHSGDPNSDWPPYGAAFPGNSTQYMVLKTNALNPGEGADWSHAVRIGSTQWLPVGNISDTVAGWALKFEVSIPDPWNGGSLCIKTSNSNFMVRNEPWQIIAPYSTKGWQTVTIPLSSFLKNDATLGDGRGAPVTSINELFGGTGTTEGNLLVYIHNYGAAKTSTGFNAAFDNFRVVRTTYTVE